MSGPKTIQELSEQWLNIHWEKYYGREWVVMIRETMTHLLDLLNQKGETKQIEQRLHKLECQAGFVKGFDQQVTNAKTPVGSVWIMRRDLRLWDHLQRRWEVDSIAKEYGKDVVRLLHWTSPRKTIKQSKTIKQTTLLKNYKRVSDQPGSTSEIPSGFNS